MYLIVGVGLCILGFPYTFWNPQIPYNKNLLCVIWSHGLGKLIELQSHCEPTFLSSSSLLQLSPSQSCFSAMIARLPLMTTKGPLHYAMNYVRHFLWWVNSTEFKDVNCIFWKLCMLQILGWLRKSAGTGVKIQFNISIYTPSWTVPIPLFDPNGPHISAVVF